MATDEPTNRADPIPVIGRGSGDTWEPTPEERAAFELLKGIPFPQDFTRADVMKARVARQLLDTERWHESHAKRENRRKMMRRGKRWDR